MNRESDKLDKFLTENPQYKGNFLGYKESRGGLGVSRIDDDWWNCEDYFIRFSDLEKILSDKKEKDTSESNCNIKHVSESMQKKINKELNTFTKLMEVVDNNNYGWMKRGLGDCEESIFKLKNINKYFR